MSRENVALLVLYILMLIVCIPICIYKTKKIYKAEKRTFVQICNYIAILCLIPWFLWMIIYLLEYTIEIPNKLIGVYLCVFGFTITVSFKARFRKFSIYDSSLPGIYSGFIIGVTVLVSGVILLFS